MSRVSVAVIIVMLAAFIIGLTVHTPPQACAENPACAEAPVNR